MPEVVEIYQTIEGEGITLGMPSILVRFAGCNLGCSWCDTPRALKKGYGREMSNGEIIEEILSENYIQMRLQFTGGEPLMYKRDIIDIAKEVVNKFDEIWIETNGTLDFSDIPYCQVSMDAKCPSSGVKSKLALIHDLTMKDQLKFVITDQTDLNYAIKVIKEYDPATNIVFQPCWPDGMNSEEYIRKTNWLTNTALAMRLKVWIIPQWHKILGVL